MEAVGIGLAVLAETRTLATSVLSRIENYQAVPVLYESVSATAVRLRKDLEDVEHVVRQISNALPEETSDIFVRSLTSARGRLMVSNDSLERNCNNLFEEGAGGALQKFYFKCRRAARAKSLANRLLKVESELSQAACELRSLHGVLTNVLTAAKMTSEVRAIQVADGEFRPGSNAPPRSDKFSFDFESKGNNGEYFTPEGALKHQLLASTSSESVTAASGAVVHGALGMAGVGKTTALIALAHDKETLARFSDGVWFVSVGADATDERMISQLAAIMESSGARSSARSVKSLKSLSEAVEKTALWFQGRECLFLVDDVWPTPGNPVGLLDCLRHVMRGSPASRMAISTRNHDIAVRAGTHVNFGAREPLGIESSRIFLAHAGCGSILPESAKPILKLCAGLPIALAITGSTVARSVALGIGLNRASEKYAKDLEFGRRSLSECVSNEGKTLSTCMLLSLESLEADLKRIGEESGDSLKYSFREMYESLCVLEKQQLVPVSVLSRIWKLSQFSAGEVVEALCNMSLAKLCHCISEEGDSESGLMLHDLQLEFCQNQAKEKSQVSQWHAHVLQCHLKRSDSVSGESDLRGGEKWSADDILSYSLRPWWEINTPNRTYISQHLCRHLQHAGLLFELAALLLDIRWTSSQGTVGGWLRVKEDFQALRKGCQNAAAFDENILMSIDAIQKAIDLSWETLEDGIKSLQFQLCSRLIMEREQDQLINSYLEKVEEVTPTPFLRPLSPLSSPEESGLVAEIPVPGDSLSTIFCWSPCGRLISTRGQQNDIIIIDLESRQVWKHLSGHEDFVHCVEFCPVSGDVVSGSRDSNIMIWDLNKSSTTHRVLRGHSKCVNDLSIRRDGLRLVSASSDCTVRMWDMKIGVCLAVLQESCQAQCISFNPANGNIATGLRDGTFTVLDSENRETVFQQKFNGEVKYVAFSNDGAHLSVTVLNQQVRVWDTRCWASGEHNFVSIDGFFFAFHPKKGNILLLPRTGRVGIWDLKLKEQVGLIPVGSDIHRYIRIVMSPDGTLIAAMLGTQRMQIWKAGSPGDTASHRRGNKSRVYSVAMSMDGSKIASGALDGSIQIWSASTSQKLGPPLQGHTSAVLCLAFSPANDLLVSASSDATMRAWETKSGVEVVEHRVVKMSHARHVAFGPTKNHVFFSEGFTIRVWNVGDKHEITKEVMTNDRGYIQALCVSRSLPYIIVRFESKIEIISTTTGHVSWASNETLNTLSRNEALQVIESCAFLPSVTARTRVISLNMLYSFSVGRANWFGYNPNDCICRYPSTVNNFVFHDEKKILAVGLESGAVKVAKLFLGSQADQMV